MAVRKRNYGKPIVSHKGYSIRPITHTITKEIRSRKSSIVVPNGKYGIFAKGKLIVIHSNFKDAVEQLNTL